jgi:hypothetical protein
LERVKSNRRKRADGSNGGKYFVRIQEGKTGLEIRTRERRKRKTEKITDQVE